MWSVFICRIPRHVLVWLEYIAEAYHQFLLLVCYQLQRFFPVGNCHVKSIYFFLGNSNGRSDAVCSSRDTDMLIKWPDFSKIATVQQNPWLIALIGLRHADVVFCLARYTEGQAERCSDCVLYSIHLYWCNNWKLIGRVSPL